MKTKEELNALKEEIETVNRKFRELTEDELEQVNGGVSRGSPVNELPDDGGCGGEIGSGK